MSLHEEYAHKKISLQVIMHITKNFADENLIGEGGFGKVYKGILWWSGKPTNIVARRLHYEYGQGDLEFWNEVSMLISLKHENIVSFIGYCNEEGEKIIINEHEANISLDKHLNDLNLTWMQRLQICVGVARGLNYIHDDVGHDFSVIHRNIKSSKILLDEKWKPKLSGFEHSKTNTRARRHRLVLAEIVGTVGYVDLTYKKTGFVTHKSDVYSLGVVLFEVLCGRRAFTPDEEEQNSPQFAKQDYKEGDVDGGKLDESSSSNGSEVKKDFFGLRSDSRPKSFVDGRPKSFVDVRRASFVGGRPTSFIEGLTSSFVDGRPTSFIDGLTSSFGGYERSISSFSSSGLEQPDEPIMSPGDVMPKESHSPKEHRFTLQPLFTMKRLEQYLHTPKEELLSQLAKFHYEEENLNEIVDPSLWEQIDPQSFKIFSETAYNCLKEQRAQRPNIDQILRNLEKALEIQTRRENPQNLVVPGEAVGTTSNRWKGRSLEHLKIPLIDIESATSNFTKVYLGSGTYGKVYRAELDLPIEEKNRSDVSRKRTTVAIKCIREDKHGKDGFIVEVELLTSCKHPNIVSLLGFCDEGPKMLLVYEYVSNRSLDNYLGRTNNSFNLTWAQRIKICIDIARGLNYLHTREEEEQRIIHRDIKSGNILLGKNWVAKIADFGLSRFHHVDPQAETLYTGNVAGTKEYLCPEYMKTGRLKRAIDIYSLGVVLFEILSGKLANDSIYIDENENGIAHVARRRYEDRTIKAIVDPKIMEEVDELASTLHKGPNQVSLETFIEIAHQCVAITQDERPTTKDILEALEKALSFQENNKDNLQMSFEEIRSATQNFSRENLIGGGGFGKVYKGEVTHGNECNTIVAKRLDRSLGQGDHHFLTELEILFEYKHENIIGLVGYCNEKHEKIIVYEYASKISLDVHLKNNSLTWIQRLKIGIDIACGLAFLHEGALTKEIVIHRDIKSANILIDGDWKAKISDFGLSSITPINQEVVSNLVGTNGYVDPVYTIGGFFTEKSDIYSFGVVLFEILYGQLVVPNIKDYDQRRVDMILKHIHEEEKLDLIVFKGIKEQISIDSLSTFRIIVSRCLQVKRDKRPMASEILQELNEALEFQEEYEIWESKLPKDYNEIIQMSKSPEIYSAKKKKDLCNILSKGILLQEEKVWFSLGCDGTERNEMISAREVSFIDSSSPHKWRSVSQSRFQEVLDMLDLMNLKVKIKLKAQFLSPNVVYGVYLVFKFSDSRPYSSKPMYVNLKYNNRCEDTLHSYFATWRDKEWMMIELFRFLNNYRKDFEFLLQSFSRYYSGDGGIYIEGIEFRTIDNVKHEKAERLKEVRQVLKSNLNVARMQKLPARFKHIFETSKNYDCNEKLFAGSGGNGKKHLMISAKEALYDSSNVKLFQSKPFAHSRFREAIQLLPQQVFLIDCTIESQMLSQDTEYICYLVFKLSEKCHGLHCPVKIRDLLQENEEAGVVYFISPSSWNLHEFTRVPEL